MQTIRWQLVQPHSTGHCGTGNLAQDRRRDCRRSLGVRRGQKPEVWRVVGVSFVNPPVRSTKAAATHGSSSRGPLPRSSEGADEVSPSQPEPQKQAAVGLAEGWEPHWDGDWTGFAGVSTAQGPLGALRAYPHRIALTSIEPEYCVGGGVPADADGGRRQG
jgi:hypothetical protein